MIINKDKLLEILDQHILWTEEDLEEKRMRADI